MTKEKVKNLLTELIDMIDNGSQRDLDRADEIGTSIIKLLEQETCEGAISRKDLISHIENQNREWGEDYDVQQILGDIEDLPSVDPQPKTGHWTRELIRNEKGGCIGAKMICSRCDNDNKHDEYMNYCPNCGAKMIEEQERSDKV